MFKLKSYSRNKQWYCKPIGYWCIRIFKCKRDIETYSGGVKKMPVKYYLTREF